LPLCEEFSDTGSAERSQDSVIQLDGPVARVMDVQGVERFPNGLELSRHQGFIAPVGLMTLGNQHLKVGPARGKGAAGVRLPRFVSVGAGRGVGGPDGKGLQSRGLVGLYLLDGFSVFDLQCGKFSLEQVSQASDGGDGLVHGVTGRQCGFVRVHMGSRFSSRSGSGGGKSRGGEVHEAVKGVGVMEIRARLLRSDRSRQR